MTLKIHFGRLKVLSWIGRDKFGLNVWNCICDCGKTTNVVQQKLKSGHTKSCGCLKYDRGDLYLISNTKLYKNLDSIKQRCYNKKNKSYKNYGGRGICVCESWLGSYKEFYDWAVENGYSEELSIDRIDNDGDYSPTNCRWVSRKVQNRNKRDSVNIEYRGEIKNLADWADELGMSYSTLRARYITYKWSVEDAFNRPVAYKRIKKWKIN